MLANPGLIGTFPLLKTVKKNLNKNLLSTYFPSSIQSSISARTRGFGVLVVVVDVAVFSKANFMAPGTWVSAVKQIKMRSASIKI